LESKKDEAYVPAKVVQVGFIDEKGLEGALMLKSDEGRTFSMRAFSGEVALHMSRFIKGDRSSLPSIYNIVEELAEMLGFHLDRVQVYSNGTALRADLYFTGKSKSLVLDGYRASDAIALALFYDASIYVEDSILQPEDSLIDR
jgi:bifunctional DNase/RNase